MRCPQFGSLSFGLGFKIPTGAELCCKISTSVVLYPITISGHLRSFMGHCRLWNDHESCATLGRGLVDQVWSTYVLGSLWVSSLERPRPLANTVTITIAPNLSSVQFTLWRGASIPPKSILHIAYPHIFVQFTYLA